MRPAAFIDRDGVLNVNPRPRGAFVTRPEQLQLHPRAAEAVKRLADAGYFTVLATNQPIVGEGGMTHAQMEAVHEHLRALLAEGAAQLDAVYIATESTGVRADWQKPGPGMLLAAAREHKLDLAASVLFGDKEKDMQAAITAGVRAVFVSGDAYPGEAERCRALRPAAQGPTFLDAVHAFLALPREES